VDNIDFIAEKDMEVVAPLTIKFKVSKSVPAR
jgi:hypothetical protein